MAKRARKETNTTTPRFRTTHYEAIANVVAKMDWPYLEDRLLRGELIDKLAIMFMEDNARFNGVKFRKRCDGGV